MGIKAELTIIDDSQISIRDMDLDIGREVVVCEQIRPNLIKGRIIYQVIPERTLKIEGTDKVLLTDQSGNTRRLIGQAINDEHLEVGISNPGGPDILGKIIYDPKVTAA